VRQSPSSARGLLLAAGLLLLVVVAFTAMGMHWWYPSALTTVAIVVLAVLAAGLARWLMPRWWRSPGVPAFLLAVAAAFVAVQFGVASGWSGWLDHDVLTPVGGEADELSTWIFAVLGGAAVYVLIGLVRRRTDRGTTEEPRAEDLERR
jgi:uncharacterized membrane protein YuzA (DUF378 family)